MGEGRIPKNKKKKKSRIFNKIVDTRCLYNFTLHIFRLGSSYFEIKAIFGIPNNVLVDLLQFAVSINSDRISRAQLIDIGTSAKEEASIG